MSTQAEASMKDGVFGLPKLLPYNMRELDHALRQLRFPTLHNTSQKVQSRKSPTPNLAESFHSNQFSLLRQLRGQKYTTIRHFLHFRVFYKLFQLHDKL